MTSEFSGDRRLRFYGPNDYASYWQVDEAANLIRDFNPSETLADASDAIELFNAHKFVEAGFLPRSLTDEERTEIEKLSSQARSTVARFFTSINETNIKELVQHVPFEYHADLLLLLGKNRAYERINASLMLRVLESTGITLGEMLADKNIVTVYDDEIRDALLADCRGAEHVIRRYFTKDTKHGIHLPRSFSPADSRELLGRYVESPDANFNYVALVATAMTGGEAGVDARLKLAAKRRNESETRTFFADNAGVKSGCELTISDQQDQPVKERLDGMVATYSYGRDWLDSTTGEASILNNFQHLFEYANQNSLLTLPSFRSELGVFERFLMTTGRTDYHIGAAYRIRDMSSTLQVQLMHHFLSRKAIDLESVIAWFFDDYLSVEFGADGFSFRPSVSGSSWLEKVRHLLVEMESTIRQFAYFAQDGEIDYDLLAIASDPIRYKQIPSLLPDKYLYPTNHPEMTGILNALFSDQSSLNYIREDLRARSAVELLIANEVYYTDFADYQRATIDQLIELGVLSCNGARVRVASNAQLLVLSLLFRYEAANYYHLPTDARAESDEMVRKGWLRPGSTLLTESEADYFNYQLNNVDFTNGPALRNKYLHGTQTPVETDESHFGTYLVTLKLIIALIIKINDDFWLADAEDSSKSARASGKRGRSRDVNFP